jgi:uncharacterized YigZ family protein
VATFSFLTIQFPTEGTYKEKGSKFLAFAFPVTSESDIKEHLASLKKEFFDARHHCYAYVLGADKTRFRGYDDGEPNHSASDPILGQIRSRQLTNVLVIVVRYFGGVKLGVGGLMQAYRAAAEDALSKISTVEVEVVKEVQLSFDYARTPEVMRVVRDFELKITEQTFQDTCHMKVLLKLRLEHAFRTQKEYLKSLGIQIIED